MNPESRLKRYRWHRQVPEKNRVMISLPPEMIDACLNQSPDGGRDKQVDRWVCLWKSRITESPGFVCLQVTDDSLTDNDLRTVYSVVSRSIGNLNQRYGEFFDVKDRGLDHTQSAIPVSKTRACSGFHTDSSSVDYCPEAVGLLCLQPGFRGGESLIANAADLYCWMWKYHRESLRPLSAPVKRDVITPGTSQNQAEIDRNAFPVFRLCPRGLQFRYMRYWISRAYEKLGTMSPPGLEPAMDLVDRFFATPANVFRTHLCRGQMLFVNNTYLCHNRTAFVDHPDGVTKRTLVRTWIDEIASQYPQRRLSTKGSAMPQADHGSFESRDLQSVG